MGEWSEYFEDFPDENPGNYDMHGRYDPNRQLRDEQARQEFAHQKLDAVLKQSGLPKGTPSKK